MNAIDQDYYNKLADWAEGEEPTLADGASGGGADSRTETRDLLCQARRPDQLPIL